MMDEKDTGRRHEAPPTNATHAHVVADSSPEIARPALIQHSNDPVRQLIAGVLPGGEAFDTGLGRTPRASVNCGAAGIAFALHRIARARNDNELLAVADVWLSRAEAIRASEDAYYSPDFEMPKDTLGTISPYHTESGIWLVKALMAHARNDTATVDQSIKRYVAAASRFEGENIDLTLGCCGVLLGAALLYDVSPDASLSQLGDRLSSHIWRDLNVKPAIGDCADACLGIAHGWAGFIYAALMWSRVAGTGPGEFILQRLAELGELSGGGRQYLRIPRTVPSKLPGQQKPAVWIGWCNGQSGHVFLQLLAGRTLGDAAYVEAAGRFGAIEFMGPGVVGDLCCGLAGRAFAMLALYRATSDGDWLERARILTARAMDQVVEWGPWPHALYKGRLGLAVAIGELDRPRASSMPLFEFETRS